MSNISRNTPTSITFVAAVNNGEILKNNLLASPCFTPGHAHQLILQEGFCSAAEAYNDAIDRSDNDLIVFCHQDMFFPPRWICELQAAIDCLEEQDPNWGVIGCSGVTQDGTLKGLVYSSGFGIIGQYSPPNRVQTLDEIVLIFRKSSGLRFDSKLPHYHLYGTDICLRAQTLGRNNYAISAFCVHNTFQAYSLPKEFFQCCEHIRRVWSEFLPIQTTCIRLTQSIIPLYIRRLSQLYIKFIRRNEHKTFRVQDVTRLFEEIDSNHSYSLQSKTIPSFSDVPYTRR